MVGTSFPSGLDESLETLAAERERNVALRGAVIAAERSVVTRFLAFVESVVGPRSRIRESSRARKDIARSIAFAAACVAAASANASAAVPPPRDTSAACRIHGALQAGAMVGIDSFFRAGSATDISSGSAIAASDAYELYGWGRDRGQNVAARGVCLIVDGKVEGRATSLYGEPRPDVAKVLLNPALAASGYLIKIPAGTLSAGPHKIGVAVVSADGSIAQSTTIRTITAH